MSPTTPNHLPRGSRRRPDISSIRVPQRGPIAVPLPLPPLSAPSSSLSSSSSSSSSSLLSTSSSSSSGTTPPLIPHGGPSSAPCCSSSSDSSHHHHHHHHPSTPLLLTDLDRVNRIGSGAGGTVYLVSHRPSSRLYALKVIYGHHEDHVLIQIRREIEILRTVNNLFVVRCYAMFDHGGKIQILLEYMDRGSLQGRRFPSEARLSEIASQILQGLSYLHSRKIVHRDIKPSNLLLDSSGRVKIADFGVSRILSQTMDPCNSSVGTIHYMSPERINTDLKEGGYDGAAADIWSFGISILELYLGRLPFGENVGDWASLMCAICLSDPPVAPPSASPEFRSFVSFCLQKEPARRHTATRLLQHPFIKNHHHHHHQKVASTALLQPLPPPPPLS